MIEMKIQIAQVQTGGNEFGAGVDVITVIQPGTPDSEGATFVGICMAINEYMRSRGAPNFDCLKTQRH